METDFKTGRQISFDPETEQALKLHFDEGKGCRAELVCWEHVSGAEWRQIWKKSLDADGLSRLTFEILSFAGVSKVVFEEAEILPRMQENEIDTPQFSDGTLSEARKTTRGKRRKATNEDQLIFKVESDVQGANDNSAQNSGNKAPNGTSKGT